MGDLHSIAYTNNTNNNNNIVSAASISSLDLAWDLQMNNINNNTPIISHNSYMENTPPYLTSFEHEHDQYSSGYLQDALFELGSDRSKRRRLILFSGSDDHHHQTNSSQICMNSIQGFWDSSDSSTTSENSGEDLCCLPQIKTQTSINSGNCTGMHGDNNIAIAVAKLSVEQDFPSSSSPNNLLLERTNYDDTHTKTTTISNLPSFEYTTTLTSPPNISLVLGKENFIKKRSPKKITRVVYPFAMVKPPDGGLEGAEFTLNDINERILMPPTRPLRHPVGDYACRPILSPRGPGLSGKTVVAFTRIQTQGRGTITIIRTKG